MDDVRPRGVPRTARSSDTSVLLPSSLKSVFFTLPFIKEKTFYKLTNYLYSSYSSFILKNVETISSKFNFFYI